MAFWQLFCVRCLLLKCFVQAVLLGFCGCCFRFSKLSVFQKKLVAQMVRAFRVDRFMSSVLEVDPAVEDSLAGL